MSNSPQEMNRDNALIEIRDLLAGLGKTGIISLSGRHLDVLTPPGAKFPPISAEDELSGKGSNTHKGGGGGRDVYVHDVIDAYEGLTAYLAQQQSQPAYNPGFVPLPSLATEKAAFNPPKDEPSD